jgi:hypothetical protein
MGSPSTLARREGRGFAFGFKVAGLRFKAAESAFVAAFLLCVLCVFVVTVFIVAC